MYVYVCLCKMSLLESVLHKIPFAGTFLIDLARTMCNSFPDTCSERIKLELRMNYLVTYA